MMEQKIELTLLKARSIEGAPTQGTLKPYDTQTRTRVLSRYQPRPWYITRLTARDAHIGFLAS